MTETQLTAGIKLSSEIHELTEHLRRLPKSGEEIGDVECVCLIIKLVNLKKYRLDVEALIYEKQKELATL